MAYMTFYVSAGPVLSAKLLLSEQLILQDSAQMSGSLPKASHHSSSHITLFPAPPDYESPEREEISLTYYQNCNNPGTFVE